MLEATQQHLRNGRCVPAGAEKRLACEAAAAAAGGGGGDGDGNGDGGGGGGGRGGSGSCVGEGV